MCLLPLPSQVGAISVIHSLALWGFLSTTVCATKVLPQTEQWEPSVRPVAVLITLTADCFAKGVYLDFEGCDPELSANFFDLTDGTPYTVKASCQESAEELQNSLRIMTVYDIGR